MYVRPLPQMGEISFIPFFCKKSEETVLQIMEGNRSGIVTLRFFLPTWQRMESMTFAPLRFPPSVYLEIEISDWHE